MIPQFNFTWKNQSKQDSKWSRFPYVHINFFFCAMIVRNLCKADPQSLRQLLLIP